MKFAVIPFFALCTVVTAATLPDNTLPNPFGVQLKSGNASTQTIDQISQLGLKSVRRGFIWESIEKTKGQYDFSDYDDLVKECQSKDLSMIGCLFGNNKLYGKDTVQNEQGRQAFAKFAAACAAHYKDANIYWEIWNEPNTQTFWGKHPKAKGNSEQFADEYVALVKAVAPAIHQADPKAIVLGGATSGIWKDSYAWMNFVFQKGILKSGIDVWSIHPYSSKCPEDYIAAYAIVRKEMADAGGPADMPMIDSERGFPIGKAEGYAGGDAKLSYEYQAWHLVRQYMIDQLEGIKLTSWYEWSGKEGFSLYDPSKPTPAYNACKVMIEQLTGYHLDKRIDVGADRDFVLRFINKTGGVKLVAWTAPPTGGTPDQAKAHNVEVPVDASGELAVVTIYGDQKSTAVEGGKVKITLEGAPRYVAVK